MGFAAAASAALLWAVPVAHGTIDPNLNLVTSSVVWTGTIHHIRTDTLATGFQKWDTTVTVDDQGARATTVFSTQYTVNVDCRVRALSRQAPDRGPTRASIPPATSASTTRAPSSAAHPG